MSCECIPCVNIIYSEMLPNFFPFKGIIVFCFLHRAYILIDSLNTTNYYGSVFNNSSVIQIKMECFWLTSTEIVAKHILFKTSLLKHPFLFIVYIIYLRFFFLPKKYRST